MEENKDSRENEIAALLEQLSIHGGVIVSTASLSSGAIQQARAGGRMYVDQNGYGFVWEPAGLIPTTEKEVALFEKWYPLPFEVPEKFKTPDWLFEKLSKRPHDPNPPK